jgi:hypothetical protein
MKSTIIALAIFGATSGAMAQTSCMTTGSGSSRYTTCSDGSSAMQTGSGSSTYTTISPGYRIQPRNYAPQANPYAGDDNDE